MAGRIPIDVYTLNGLNYHYDIDIGVKIIDIIRHILATHKAFEETPKFNPQLVDINQVKLIYNGKTLDQSKTLEEYTEFQYKPKGGGYKMHIVVKGGEVIAEPSDSSEPPCTSYTQTNNRSSSPISIKNHSGSVSSRVINDKNASRSFPGTSSFLDSQINRLDRRQRKDSLKQVSDSVNHISQFLKDFTETGESSERLDKIMQMLVSIDAKLNQLIENTV